MKKVFFVIMLCAACISVSAQGRYRHGVGVVVGSLNGLSYKTFLSENFCIQADAAFGIQHTIAGDFRVGEIELPKKSTYEGDIWTASLNPNFLYQSLIQTWDWGGISVFGGAGFSLGCMDHFTADPTPIDTYINSVMGKFGVNVMAGVELGFDDVPVSIQLDLRPGYGLGFLPTDHDQTVTMSFFDWAAALSVRYVF